jgi:hypothetical protein
MNALLRHQLTCMTWSDCKDGDGAPILVGNCTSTVVTMMSSRHQPRRDDPPIITIVTFAVYQAPMATQHLHKESMREVSSRTAQQQLFETAAHSKQCSCVHVYNVV